jgi:putative PEP-CTERM system histidine kinase
MNATPVASVLLHAGSATVCLSLAVLLLVLGRGGRAGVLPALAALLAGVWAGAVALDPATPLGGTAATLETLRNAAWLGLLLLLGRITGGERAVPLTRRFAIAGAALALLSLQPLAPGAAGALALPTLGSPALLGRIGLSLLIVLLAENLYRNAHESARWSVNLPCIALGGLGAFDVLLYADAALAGAFSTALLDARAVLTALAMPLLALAATRQRRWRREPQVSREIVFHGATLVVAGAFLLVVGAMGELLRRIGQDWAQAAQVSLFAAAVMAVMVALTSGSARSRLKRLVVDHFFTGRYDYRREWLRCVAALSASDEEAPAAVRAVRAVADTVDSPGGALLLRETGGTGFGWSGSWNLPAEGLAIPGDHPLVAALRDGGWIAEIGPEGGAAAAALDLRERLGPLWLAVPLPHHREGLIGVVLLAPPRAPFELDREVYDLLRSLGREVAMFLAERQAAERLADQRRLGDYAKRFAFVAHDVKTVSSQLTLLLANADENIQDPEFQRDMLLTVRASAQRINALIARLRQPGDEPLPEAPAQPPAPASVAPLDRLRAIAAGRVQPVLVEAEGAPSQAAAISADRFDAAVTHLLDNAAEASPPGEPVRVTVREQAGRVEVDIADRGPGMTAEFIRDELFRPLSTSKPQGSGIGAWQARELLREAGGELAVLSRPGAGTTMRLVIPLAGAEAAGAASAVTPEAIPS